LSSKTNPNKKLFEQNEIVVVLHFASQSKNQIASNMKIIRAEHLGMCFGVRDAINLALATAKHEPLTILGDLVHNETVLAELRARKIRIEQQPDNAQTRTVMITAHGASERKLAAIRNRGHNVLEATCPLVHVAHRSLQKLVAQGFHPVIIGKRGHVEVRGMTEDLDAYDVVLSEEEVNHLAARPRFGVIAQTTQPIDKVRQLVQLLREHFPASEVCFKDTVCQPTKQRQNAAVEIARQSDVVVVIGGANSNNTHELVKTCSRFCPRVRHVQTADDLVADWFRPEDTVGITAGTSTPDRLIQQVEKRLRTMALIRTHRHAPISA
jgi:4-hydroxy-3-methylbut-2-enyl diphosphate reductase